VILTVVFDPFLDEFSNFSEFLVTTVDPVGFGVDRELFSDLLEVSFDKVQHPFSFLRGSSFRFRFELSFSL
jgi:hypothetical protein